MKLFQRNILKRFRKNSEDYEDLETSNDIGSAVSTSLGGVVEKTSYQGDSPIADPSKDEFNRWGFSQRIAQTLAARQVNNSLVVAIYGKWGEGKTTVLNFIEAELKKHTNVIPLKYNPWRFQSEPELLISFFQLLADALKKSLPTLAEKIGRLCDSYIVPAASLIGGDKVIEGVVKLLSGASLDELRDRIGEMLKKEGRLVVVLMDDIDRLEKTEIHALFRLVKLTANFDNIAFVLAFDDQIVADALQERYGTSNREAGRNFLEKIVQVPLNLPRIDLLALRNYCFLGVEKALNHAEILLSEEDIRNFYRGFVEGLEIRLHTPRMAVRYANMLLFSLPMIKGEVNIVDFLLIEGIRAFYPAAYGVIRDNREAFTLLSYVNPGEHADRIHIRELIDNVYVDLIPLEKDALQRLLYHLFPRLESIYGNNHFGNEWDQSWTNEKRAASANYFDRYFSYSIPTTDISDQAIQSLLLTLNEGHLDNIFSSINGLLTARNADSFVAKLHQNISILSPEATPRLAFALSLIGDRFPNPQQLFSFTTPFARAAMLIARLIENVTPPEVRIELANHIIDNGRPISFVAEMIRWLRTDQTASPSGLSEDNKINILKRLAQRIEQQAKDGMLLYDEFPREAPLLISCWSKFSSREQVDAYIKSYIENNNQNVHKILLSYVPMAYPTGGEIPHKDDFRREQYDQLADVMEPSVLYQTLVQIYGDELDSVDYPEDFTEKSTEKRIARQFTWIYRYVEAEKAKNLEQNKTNSNEETEE